MSWSRKFDDPIPGIVTLKDAAEYIIKLPKAEREKPHWQTAGEVVLMAAEGTGPLLHARIGMLRAMNHGKAEPAKEPRRKAVKKYRIVK